MDVNIGHLVYKYKCPLKSQKYDLMEECWKLWAAKMSNFIILKEDKTHIGMAEACLYLCFTGSWERGVGGGCSWCEPISKLYYW